MAEIAAGAADFISMCSVVEVGESRMKSINYNYQSFLPGKSCKSIYNSKKVVIIRLDIILLLTGVQVECIVE